MRRNPTTSPVTLIAETLRDQVEKFVIRFELGDFEPLAEIVIDPPADSDDVERDMKIDNHLAALGVRLSKSDALQRYGRTEAEDENDALTPPAAPSQGGFGALANEQHPQTALQTREKPLQNAAKQKDGQSPVQDKSALKSKIFGVSGTTALEGAIADIIAETFAEEVSKAAQGEEEAAEELANAADAQGNEHSEANGQFVSKGEGGSRISVRTPADKPDASRDSGSSGASGEAASVAVGSTNTDSPEEQSRQIAKAAAAFEKCLAEQIDVPSAFHRSDIGDIDLRWGKTNKGLQHMVARRDAFAKAHPGAPDGKAVIAKMPETIIKGKVSEVTHSGGHPNIAIERDGYRAIITRDREGGNHWFISGYDISDEGRGYRAKRK